MKSINDMENYDLVEIFGEEAVKKWKKAYPTVFENKDVRSWIRNMISQYTDEGKDPKGFTITSYFKPIEQYAEFNEVKDPSMLLTETIDERNNRVKNYFTTLKNLTLEKAKEMGFRKVPTDVSIRNGIQSRIKSFYADRGVNVSYGIKTRKSGDNVKEITLDKELVKIIKHDLETIEYRLLCKFSTQTGLRINDILQNLTSGKYTIEKYKEHYVIKNFRTKKESVIIPFIFFTNELSLMLKSAMRVEDITEIDLTKLFLTRNKQRINEQNFLQRIKKIVKDQGIKGNIKTHCIRKLFTTTLETLVEKGDIDKKFSMVLTGHTLNFRDEAYNKNLTSIEWFYQKWIKIEEHVCIDCIITDKTDSLTKEHQAKIENFEAKYNTLIDETIQKDKLIQDMQKLIQLQTKKLDDIEKKNDERWTKLVKQGILED